MQEARKNIMVKRRKIRRRKRRPKGHHSLKFLSNVLAVRS
jgi:hypothetical protein